MNVFYFYTNQVVFALSRFSASPVVVHYIISCAIKAENKINFTCRNFACFVPTDLTKKNHWIYLIVYDVRPQYGSQEFDSISLRLPLMGP